MFLWSFPSMPRGIHLFTFKNHQSRGSISDKQSKTKLYGWSECNETETKLVKINQQISLTTWRRRCGPGSVSAAAPQCCTAPPQRHWSRQSLPWAGGRRWSGSPGHGTHICSGIELRPQTGVEQPWTHDSVGQWEWQSMVLTWRLRSECPVRSQPGLGWTYLPTVDLCLNRTLRIRELHSCLKDTPTLVWVCEQGAPPSGQGCSFLSARQGCAWWQGDHGGTS